LRRATLSHAASNDGRPAGVTAISIGFLSASAYLVILGVVKLANPEAIPLSLGAPLLHGLEIDGPYMFLLAGGFGLIVAFGLFRLKNLARRAAIAIAVAGMVMLLPKVSAAATDISARFFVAGSMVVVRMVIVWYLWQSWTAEKFS
jgi:hypothetical protein